uniref:Major facilitator superfamily MFS_1 n=1 Tax=Cyanothece sp. (strain PCC 7425 / ATCC 29141) TaxID=395961 RepID=B8HLS8_CYAP4
MDLLRRSISPLYFLCITIFIDRLGESLIFPILPFLVKPFNFNALTLTLLFSAFAAAQFLAAPILGTLSDRYGRRPVLLICVLGTALSYFMFALAQQGWMLFVSRILDGITGGVASTAQAYIADSSAPEDRAKNFGLTGAAFGLGFVLGPALGGSLATINLKLPIVVAGIIALSNFILGYFTLPESLKPESRRTLQLKDFNPLGQLRDLFRDRSLAGLLWAFFIFNFAFAGFTSVFVLFLNQRFGWGPSQAALVFVVIGITITVVQAGLIRKLIPRFREGNLTIVGLFLLGLGFSLTALVPPQKGWLQLGIFLAAIAIASGVGLLLPCLRGLISNQVSDQEQGRVIGSSQSLQSVASILGPAWAGWSFDKNPLTPIWQSTLLVGLALGFTLLNLQRQRRSYPS